MSLPTLPRVEQLHAAATRAAARYTPGAKPLAWDAALAAAKPRQTLTPDEEAVYRDSFARALVRLGRARRKGASGPSGKSRLPKREFRATAEELEAQDRLAGQAGKSWNQWAREKLSR